MPEPTTPIHLTHLEVVASACATAAVADSAPPGSPGEPILTANEKFNAAMKSPAPASPQDDGGEGRLVEELAAHLLVVHNRTLEGPGWKEISEAQREEHRKQAESILTNCGLRDSAGADRCTCGLRYQSDGWRVSLQHDQRCALYGPQLASPSPVEGQGDDELPAIWVRFDGRAGLPPEASRRPFPDAWSPRSSGRRYVPADQSHAAVLAEVRKKLDAHPEIQGREDVCEWIEEALSDTDGEGSR